MPDSAHNSEPHLWVKISLGDAGEVGPGKIALLRLIREHRSIAGAARAMNMSYRRAWLLINELNQIFGQPVLSTFLGGRTHGGAELTPLGEALIARFDSISSRAEAAVREELSALAAEVRSSD
ncbi:MAG: LysR family transcriptional regulator [Alphaproteobacteria bacterium]|nr:LysR family transcriptional regulator [Alphaproteobacteria bacterium]